MISSVSQMKYRFEIFLHSKFGLISFISTPPLLTFASSSGLKFMICVVKSSPCPFFSRQVEDSFQSKKEGIFFIKVSNFFVILFGVIFRLMSSFLPCLAPAGKEGDHEVL